MGEILAYRAVGGFGVESFLLRRAVPGRVSVSGLLPESDLRCLSLFLALPFLPRLVELVQGRLSGPVGGNCLGPESADRGDSGKGRSADRDDVGPTWPSADVPADSAPQAPDRAQARVRGQVPARERGQGQGRAAPRTRAPAVPAPGPAPPAVLGPVLVLVDGQGQGVDAVVCLRGGRGLNRLWLHFRERS